MSGKIQNILIPQLNQLPAEKAKEVNKLKSGEKSEFEALLKGQEVKPEESSLKVSSHALKRLEERNIEMDSSEYVKLQDAMKKLKSKGGHDSLVITSKAAYVLDVDKGMVVTAVDKNNMNENVFTKIDSTIFMQ
jgi:flagellar operon protein